MVLIGVVWIISGVPYSRRPATQTETNPVVAALDFVRMFKVAPSPAKVLPNAARATPARAALKGASAVKKKAAAICKNTARENAITSARGDLSAQPSQQIPIKILNADRPRGHKPPNLVADLSNLGYDKVHNASEAQPFVLGPLARRANDPPMQRLHEAGREKHHTGSPPALWISKLR